ncbi:MAG TPA: alpha/beta hydrolase [Burkholderiaceae bacterium]
MSGTVKSEPVRVLIVPGLHDSGPEHWQSQLQRGCRGALRVEQHDWAVPDLERWADRIAETLAHEKRGPWVAVAHSFGCLALVRALNRTRNAERDGIRAALLVAPADPLKFGVAESLPCRPLPVASTLVASRNDPWMPFGSAVNWSRVWGSQLVDLGHAGHVNVASGHGPWPLAKQLVERLVQQVHRERRLERAHPLELSFAI